MRRFGLLTAALVLVTAGTASAQFNPHGRTKKGKPAPSAAPRRPAAPSTSHAPTAAPVTPKPTPPDPSSTAPAAPSRASAEREALILRYLGAALAQPGAEFPIQRLIELYRERDGKLDALVAELERRANGNGAERYAALLALASLERLEGDTARALERYEHAAALAPHDPAAELAMARLFEQKGETVTARAHYERALERNMEPAAVEQVLRSLRTLALDQRDFGAAERYQRDLEKRAKGSFFVRSELGRELAQRGEHERAVSELKAVAKAAAGDNRVLAPALRDLGVAEGRAGKRADAIATLERALALAGGAAGIRRDVYQALVEVYRADQRLPELTARLERGGARNADELRLLGGLYEESGRVDKALTTYRAALAREPGDVATRLKVVSLLEAQGALDEAVREYEGLIRAAPRNPDYVFRLVSVLMQRGDRVRALEELRKLEARSTGDEDTLAALVELYERLGEKDKSLALLERLAGTGGRDPQHLVELGARYWAAGDKNRALGTWQRIRTALGDRVQALLVEGDVLIDHDLVKEGLDALAEAARLEPDKARTLRAHALGLERAAGGQSSLESRRIYLDQALALWEKLLQAGATPADVAREARQHVVTLWGLRGQSGQRMNGLAKRFGASPPDLQAGRLLAEAALRARRYPDAERTLQKLAELAPGDAESRGQLVTVLVQERKLKDAIDVLERLVALEPKRAREHYQRMAEYAAELYRDDDAIRYAARAVELAPEDADGHARLGRLYRRRQQTARAIAELRLAVQKNDRAFAVALELGELLQNEQAFEEADLLLRRVIRASPDDELVSRAFALSVQLNQSRHTLESLERELLPVALANPERPLFRRLLIEVYGASAFQLVNAMNNGTPAEAEDARKALARLGDRAVKPLLDALSDERESQQLVALTLLEQMANKNAGPALVAYATGTADPALRQRAMIAAGKLRDATLLPKLEAALFGDGATPSDADPVKLAAAWSVARLVTPRARPLLARLLGTEAPGLRALGALGLGLLHDGSAAQELGRVLGAPDAGNVARAAAARALGMLGAQSAVEAIASVTHAPDPELRIASLFALAELRAKDAASPLADAMVDRDPAFRQAAAMAAAAWATGSFRAPSDPLPPPREAKLTLEQVLEDLRPVPPSAKERVLALEKLAPALERASENAARSSPERAQTVLEALGLLPGSAPFPALTADLSPDELARARRVVDDIGAKLVPVIATLSRLPTPSFRLLAVQFFARRSEPLAHEAIVTALGDADRDVRREALRAAPTTDPSVAQAVAQRLGVESEWALRVDAAEALGRAPGSGAGAAELTLAADAVHDVNTRIAALRALSRVSPAAARPVLERAKTDPEAYVRSTALELLGGLR